MPATLDEKTVTPLQAWMLRFDSSVLTPLQIGALVALAQKADPQTGEVQHAVSRIHKAIRTSMWPGKAKEQRQLIADALDEMTEKGILKTLAPGTMGTKEKPGVAAKRQIVFKREVAGG